MMWRKLQLIG
uniref:Uncharacterized protein n=1 Tax=Arundo donax TaxID=35708 RepID=A0A0A8ZB69_ARUDO